MRIPFVNRFTCSPRQLPSIINQVKKRQMIPILDNINENGKDYQKNYQNIIQTIQEYPMTTFAIKLSSLNIADPKHNYLKVLDDVHHICDLAIENSSRIIIDAEQISINDTIDEVSDLMMETYNKSCVNVYKTYQMYRRDTMSKYLQDLKEERDYFVGAKIVRGAYYNEDIDTDLLFSQIEHTHKAYDDAIRYFTENSSSKDKLLCATHNFNSNDIAKNYIHNGKKNIEIGHLLGMADYLSEELVQEGVSVYKYIPFGEFNETLPYLSRRLYENYPLIKHM